MRCKDKVVVVVFRPHLEVVDGDDVISRALVHPLGAQAAHVTRAVVDTYPCDAEGPPAQAHGAVRSMCSHAIFQSIASSHLVPCMVLTGAHHGKLQQCRKAHDSAKEGRPKLMIFTTASFRVVRVDVPCREGAALRRGVAGVAGCHWAGWSSLLAVQRTCYRAPREDTVGFQSSRCATSS